MWQDLLGIALVLVGLISAFVRGRDIARSTDAEFLTEAFSERR